MPAEYVIPYAALLDMLLYNACNKNPSVIVCVESNTGLKYNVNIWGRVKSPAVILHLLCAASAQTILLLLRIKRHFKGSILLLLKLVSVLRANTFNIDPPPPTFIAIPSSEACSYRLIRQIKDFTKWLEEK